MGEDRKVIRKFIYLIIVAIAAGCSGYSVTGGPKPVASSPLRTEVIDGDALFNTHSVLALPVINGLALRLGENDLAQLTAELREALKSELTISVIEAKSELGYAVVGDSGAVKHGVESARKLGADAVLITVVERYTQREGSRAGADEAALVDLRMTLVSISSSQPIWRASYYYRDQALSENLFKIQQRAIRSRVSGGWLSAQEIARSAFKEVALSLEQARQGAKG